MDSNLKRRLAETLRVAELEYRRAQAALVTDNSDKARKRYARALATYDRLQGMFQMGGPLLARSKRTTTFRG